jgi:hypothetical protein
MGLSVMRCLFCGQEALDSDHLLHCGDRNGRVEASPIGFHQPSEAPAFDGETYEPEYDHERLGAQALRVWALIQDGEWRTLAEIEALTGDPQASISARLRDFRKRKFGQHVVERRRRETRRGLWEYRALRGTHDEPK